MTEPYLFGADGIMERLPHRHPFLMIDEVLACEPGKSIVAAKNVTGSELYFAGHFPGHPVMPGVLVLESMAQAAGVLVWESVAPEERTFILYLVGVEKARFKRPVHPGDRVVIEVELGTSRRGLWRFGATAKVGEQLVASAEILQAPGRKL